MIVLLSAILGCDGASVEPADADDDGYADTEDCDDADPDIHPFAYEGCGDPDRDCDGLPHRCLEDEWTWVLPGSSVENYLSTAGDVDGDGRADIMIGSACAVSVDIFVGADLPSGGGEVAGPRWNIDTRPPGCGDEFGIRNGTFLPDLDGDGRSELLLGVMDHDVAYVLSGSALGAAFDLELPEAAGYTLTVPSGAYNFGQSVAAAGDVWGDDVEDVLVSSDDAVWVVPASLLTTPAVDVEQGLRINNLDSDAGSFGRQSVGAGDVDGDGLGDVLVDCVECGGGAVFLFLGASLPTSGERSTLDADVAVQAAEDASYSFAYGLQGGRDLDGDGRDDWVSSGTPGYSMGGSSVYLWFDSAAGSNLTTDDAGARILEANGEGYLGPSLTMGDFDGDGGFDLAAADDNPSLELYLITNPSLPRTGSVGILDVAVRLVTAEEEPWGWGPLALEGDLDADGMDDLLYADSYWRPDDSHGFGTGVIFAGRESWE